MRLREHVIAAIQTHGSKEFRFAWLLFMCMPFTKQHATIDAFISELDKIIIDLIDEGLIERTGIGVSGYRALDPLERLARTSASSSGEGTSS